jgi:hypothetical protein
MVAISLQASTHSEQNLMVTSRAGDAAYCSVNFPKRLLLFFWALVFVPSNNNSGKLAFAAAFV